MLRWLVIVGLTLVVPSFAGAEVPVIEIKIKDHKFHPDVVEIKEGQKVQLLVINEGPGAEEFESHELNREKVILPGKSAKIFIGPLKKGEYKFFGEFHPETAQGKIRVK